MKKWTKKFLDSEPAGERNLANTIENAAKAEKKIKFPKERWTTICGEAQLHVWLQEDWQDAFAAGLAIGWAEHEESVE